MVRQIFEFKELREHIMMATDDIIDFLHFILYHLEEPKNQTKREHILAFNGFPFKKESEVYFCRRNIIMGFLNDQMQEKLCNLLQIQSDNKLKTVTRILDYFFTIFNKEYVVEDAEEILALEEMYDKFNEELKIEYKELCDLHATSTDFSLKFDLLKSIEKWGKKREHVREKLQEIRQRKRDLSLEYYVLTQKQHDMRKYICNCPNGEFSSLTEHYGYESPELEMRLTHTPNLRGTSRTPDPSSKTQLNSSGPPDIQITTPAELEECLKKQKEEQKALNEADAAAAAAIKLQQQQQQQELEQGQNPEQFQIPETKIEMVY